MFLGRVTVNEVVQLLDKFRTLDLSTYLKDEVVSFLQKIRPLIPVYETVFHTGTVFYRAKPSEEASEFTKRADLSYKPQKFNKTYQRASTPNRTMFYGAVVTENDSQHKLNDKRIIAACEVSPLLRNPNLYQEEKQKIVYGKWRAQSNCRLATILFSDINRNVTPSAKLRGKKFSEWLKSEHPDYVPQASLLIDFFAEEYAKEGVENGEDFKYIISASH